MLYRVFLDLIFLRLRLLSLIWSFLSHKKRQAKIQFPTINLEYTHHQIAWVPMHGYEKPNWLWSVCVMICLYIIIKLLSRISLCFYLFGLTRRFKGPSTDISHDAQLFLNFELNYIYVHITYTYINCAYLFYGDVI